MADDPYAAFSSPVQQPAQPAQQGAQPTAAAGADPYAAFSSPVNAQQTTTQQPTRGFFPSSFGELGSDLVGGAEGALNFTTGAAASLGGGLGYLGTLLVSRDPDAAKAVQEAINQKLTYAPRSQSGQEASANIGSVLNKIPQGADAVGGWVTDKTGLPSVGAAINTGLQAIPMIFGGKVAGAVGEKLVGGAESALSKYRPGFARTPEAQRLLDAGVELTPGLMKPGGIADSFEQLPTKAHVPVLGGVMSDARANARTSWQRYIAEKAAAPGTKITATDINEMADQASASFTPLYDQAKGFPVSPSIVNAGQNFPLASAFKSASKSRNIQADNATRASTEAWLTNKLTELKSKPGQPLDSGQLIELRSAIRSQIRKNSISKDSAKNDSADLMRVAEDAVTKSLESQLPPAALQVLRAADAKYGDYKTFENAVLKAKDNPNGFSPENLSQAIKEGTSAGVYAKGGGRLRQEAKDAKAVFSSNVPPTGAIIPAIGAAAGLAVTHPLLAGPLALGGTLLSATKAGRKFAAGNTFIQNGAKRITNELSKQR